jgi:acetyl esterase/lipase
MFQPIRQSTATTGENLYWPAGEPRGGIVCLHGSEGGWAGWNDLTCALFAAHGFAALSHNYTINMRWPVHPDIDDVPLESTQVALATMRNELAPFGCGLGLYGISRGAERALLVAQLLMEDGCAEVPDAVAVHSPPDETWPAFLVADFVTGKPWTGDRQRPSWSWRGGHEHTRPGMLLGTAPTSYPVFVAQGTKDQTWDAGMAQRLVARLAEAGSPPEAHFFEDEGHVFRAEARNREWVLLVDFFARHLSGAVLTTKAC